MGKFLETLFRLGNAYLTEKFKGSFMYLFLGYLFVVDFHHFLHLLAHANKWVQRGHRILKDHCDFLSSDLPQPLDGYGGKLLAFKENGAIWVDVGGIR